MKPWWQSKIIWASIIAFFSAIADLIVVTPFDWSVALGAFFALIIALFRAFGTTKTIGTK
jgi:hypothetical protein